MHLLISILFLTLLIIHINGSNVNKVPHDIRDLRHELQNILDNALLNQNGSDIVKIGRQHIVDLEKSDCTQEVLSHLIKECAHMTLEKQSEIAMMYLTCRLRSIPAELPSACQQKQTWFSGTWSAQSTCKQALFEHTSMWTTYDGFLRDISPTCFAHTFDLKLQMIETGTVELIETGHDIITGITGLVKQVFDFQLQTMPYLQSIQDGVQNTIKEISLLTTIVSKLYNLTERIADRVDVILADLDNVTSKVSDIGSAIDNNTIALDMMNGKMMDLEKRIQNFFEFFEACRPFIKKFAILCNPPYLLLFSCTLWMWWYHLHGLWSKLFSIVTLCIFKQILVDGLWHTPPYVFMIGCICFILVSASFYYLLSTIHFHRCCKDVREKLKQTREEHWNGNVY